MKKSNADLVVQLFLQNSPNIFDNWILSYFPSFSPLSSESPQLAVSEETQERIKNQSSLFLGKSCNYVTNPLEEVSRTDYAFLPEGGRAATAAGENEPARSQIMRDTNSLIGLQSNNALDRFYTAADTVSELWIDRVCCTFCNSGVYEVLFQKQPFRCDSTRISSF